MSVFSDAWEKLLPASAGKPEPQAVTISRARRRKAPAMHASQQEWDSTLNTAVALAQSVTGHPPSEEEQERGAVAVHYAIGAIFGVLYSVAREHLPEIGAGAGAPFGAAAFVVAQEIGTPRLGLSKAVGKYSLSMQANSLGEHVAWGVTTELTRRLLWRVL